jgi:Ni/Co efflux regulator RcnB
MKLKTIVVTLFASALVAAPLAAVAQGNGNKGATDSQKRAQVERSQRDLDRDRLQTRDRSGFAEQERNREQERTNAPDDAKQAEHMYGYNLMTEEERVAYRERLMKAESAAEKEQIKAQHREEIQVRARNRNVEIDDDGNPVPED